MFGVSRQRAYQLTQRADFPEPEGVLQMGKVWDKEKVRAWAVSKGREVKG
jgi:predicted DNA-binding transcriptional regulator AlpA